MTAPLPLDGIKVVEIAQALAGPFAGEPIVALIMHILDEVVHHAAEVALLRDLYPTIGRGSP